MSISKEDARDMILKLLPHVWSESVFLGGPVRALHIPAQEVFDVIRNMMAEPMTEEDFNKLADWIERNRS